MNRYTPVELLQLACLKHPGDPNKILEAFRSSVMVSEPCHYACVTKRSNDTETDVDRIVTGLLTATPDCVSHYALKFFNRHQVFEANELSNITAFFTHKEDNSFSLIYIQEYQGPQMTRTNRIKTTVISTHLDTNTVSERINKSIS